MKLDVFNLENSKVGEVAVSESVFATEVKPYLHHEVVRYQLAKRRSGTHKVKTRAEITGTTKKMYKQKGTGRARHGSSKAPVFVGGGIVHGPTPRNHAFKLPKKVRRGALRSALSQKVSEGKLKVVDKFDLEAPKTRLALAHLEKLGAARPLVVDVDNETLKLSVRNLPKAKYLQSAGLNVYDLMKYDFLVMTEAAVKHIDGVLNR